MHDDQTVDVLIVESDPDQRRLLGRMLVRAGLGCIEAGTIGQARDQLRNCRPTIIVSAYELPDGSSVDLCAVVRQVSKLDGAHFIVFHASALGATTRDLLDCGADDCVSKLAGWDEVVARVRVGLRFRAMHEKLRRAAVTDGLTGLFNHDHFNRLLDAEVNRSRRFGHPLALVMIDLDYFKAINDNFGHLVGNATLEAVAEVLCRSVREVDTVARFGGEEFAIIVPEATCGDIIHVADRIRRALAEEINLPALRGHRVTASFGLADTDDPRVNGASDLTDLADRALYVAKRRGRDQIVAAVELDDRTELEVRMEVGEADRLRREIAAQNVRTRDMYFQSVTALLQALHESAPSTARHAVNVAFYSRCIAAQMGCSRGVLKAIQNASLLHDVGKIGVPGRILMKRSPLSMFERRILARVPDISTRIVSHLRVLDAEMQIIRHQRERYDGSGSPEGLEGTNIPIGARILLVADAFDAMTTDCAYRARRPINAALDELDAHSGTQFDPRAVLALRQVVTRDRRSIERRIKETVESLNNGSAISGQGGVSESDSLGGLPPILETAVREAVASPVP
ncbi:MAG: diguanylate cyclase [Phycisphaerae bacterium]|nr:diguanylate cyclase [Phycisphaerae bacterium]